MTAGMRPLALGALASGLMILLVCAANATNLLVARGIHRAKDAATRRALGASRADILRLLLFELALLAAIVTTASLLLAHVALGVVATAIPAEYVRLGELGVDARLALFTALLTLTILGCCAVPAWLSLCAGRRTLRPGSVEEPRTIRWWRFALVAGQTCVALVLLLGSSFLLRSYVNLWQQDTGYAGDTRFVSVSYPGSHTPARMTASAAATVRELRRVPGVSDAAAGISVGYLLDGYFGAGGTLLRAAGERLRLVPAQVSEGYFDVVGTRLLAGRALTAADRGWEAVVLNESAAERLFPGVAPAAVVGRHLTANDKPALVVGVVQNARDRALDAGPAPRVYKPIDLSSSPLRRVMYAVRATPGIEMHDLAVRRVIRAVDSGAVVEAIDTADGRLAESIRDRSFATLMFALFATAALGVTGAGIFAVVAFVVARRTRELAIRLALGARPGHLLSIVVGDAVLAAAVGAAGGLLAGRWLAQALDAYLFGMTAGDPYAPVLAAATLIAAAALAAWWPARRALRLQPSETLRVE
jgi:predicted permease